MRKVLCSIGSGPHAELLDVSGETFRVYADRHGYDLELRTELVAPDRPPAWSKVALLRELLGDYEFAFWVDADAAIVDPSRDLADEVRRGKGLYLVAHHYDGQVLPNTGVVGIRAGRRAQRFLDALWRSTEYLEHKWWENAAALHLLGYEFEPVVQTRTTRWSRWTRYLPREWNSVAADPSPHPLINHYPGRSQEYRLERLRADAALLRSRVGAAER